VRSAVFKDMPPFEQCVGPVQLFPAGLSAKCGQSEQNKRSAGVCDAACDERWLDAFRFTWYRSSSVASNTQDAMEWMNSNSQDHQDKDDCSRCEWEMLHNDKVNGSFVILCS